MRAAIPSRLRGCFCACAHFRPTRTRTASRTTCASRLCAKQASFVLIPLPCSMVNLPHRRVGPPEAALRKGGPAPRADDADLPPPPPPPPHPAPPPPPPPP